jgi:hypothetical protein
MSKSSKFEKVKYYYNHSNWSIHRVRKAVADGWITEDEFYEITGESY